MLGDVDPDEFRRLRNFSMRLVAFIGVPVTVASMLLAPRTIDFLYGPSFAAASSYSSRLRKGRSAQ